MRGGKRKGAGRPRKNNRKRISASFSEETVKRIREEALREGEKQIGPWLERAAVYYLEKQ